MRILIFNWRDIKNHLAGGAEIVTHAFARNLTQRGHVVTLFCRSFPGALEKEQIDGVFIIRKGQTLINPLRAFWFYVRNRNSFDIIIDQIHGLPFFTPLYVHKPILAYIHEVAGKIWYVEYPFPLNFLGDWCEHWYFNLYREIPFFTGSLSTTTELIAKGIPENHISVIPPAYESKHRYSWEKYSQPTLIFIGRLTPMKRIHWLIEALAYLSRTNIRLIIVGRGRRDYVNSLKTQISLAGLDKQVLFLGYVGESKKIQLLKKSWIHVHPSLKEGFGLTVLEAAAYGTPTVSFAVSALRDLVTSSIGICIRTESSYQLASALLKLTSDKKLLKKLSRQAYTWSKQQPTWQQETTKLEKLLIQVVDTHKNQPISK